MNYPAASCGVSEERDENYPKASPPIVFIGVQFRTRLDSRLKHAGNDGLRIGNLHNAASCGELTHRD
jgi:hypothetical protein